jgi:hypothetical protein
MECLSLACFSEREYTAMHFISEPGLLERSCEMCRSKASGESVEEQAAPFAKLGLAPAGAPEQRASANWLSENGSKSFG